MRIDVTEYEKKYTFEFDTVAQLCGQNIIKKSYMLESLRRFFSTHKYQEGEDKWRDNVKVDEQLVGRKYFSIISIKGMEDVLAAIKWSKQSLMLEYVKHLVQKFDWQMHLEAVNEELEVMFQIINPDINQLGEIELTYSESEVWDMVQKTNVVSTEGVQIENKENYELLTIFLNLLEAVMKVNPKKTLVILENIDHIISREEYIDVVNKIQNIGMKNDIRFVLSTSLEGYVAVDNELCSGIAVFGEEDFQMPEYNKMLDYIYENYPYNKDMTREQIQRDLVKIIQKIGQKEYLSTVEENVICKMINQTIMLHERWNGEGKNPEIAFLKA